MGAVPLAYHGFPRYTGALDIFVRNTPENAQQLEAGLSVRLEPNISGVEGS